MYEFLYEFICIDFEFTYMNSQYEFINMNSLLKIGKN